MFVSILQNFGYDEWIKWKVNVLICDTAILVIEILI